MAAYRRVHRSKRDDTASAVLMHGKEVSRRDCEIATAYSQGTSVQRIARRYNLTTVRIYQIINKLRDM
jgi:Mor family transcriptional regulator